MSQATRRSGAFSGPATLRGRGRFHVKSAYLPGDSRFAGCGSVWQSASLGDYPRQKGNVGIRGQKALNERFREPLLSVRDGASTLFTPTFWCFFWSGREAHA